MDKSFFMLRHITIVALVLGQNTILGQNCPTGFVERLVKCKGQFVKKCIPENYNCKACWRVEYPPCQNSKTGGGSSNHNSYEEAVAEVRRMQKNIREVNIQRGKAPEDCGGWHDYFSPKIFFNDCGESNKGQGATDVADLRNRIKPFLQRYIKLITDYNRELQGKPFIPGAVTQDYQNQLRLAVENRDKLQNYVNILTEANLSMVEDFFEKVQEHESTLKQSYNNYINASSNTQSFSIGQPAQPKNNFQQEYQSQINTIDQQYQANLQRNEQIFNAVQTGIQNIASILEQNAQRKAEERRRQYEYEQKLREQRRQEELEKERQKQEEENRRYNELLRQYHIDSSILSTNNYLVKPSKIPSNIDSIYYIGYKREYDENSTTFIILKTFIVYRYSDDTFPLFSKIKEKSNHENDINQSGISILIGYFDSKKEMENTINDIQRQAEYNGINCKIDRNPRKINSKTTGNINNDNFWKQ